MHITHSYLGTKQDRYQCLFYLLLEDYIEAQSQFIEELNPYLQRFARQLKFEGAVFKPFDGDIEETRQHVLDKSWTKKELGSIYKTPSLLMISVDFDEFDPTRHKWAHIYFGDKITGNPPRLADISSNLDFLAESILLSNIDVFEIADKLFKPPQNISIIDILDVKLGFLGFSIDLKGAAQMLRYWIQNKE